MNNSEKIVLLVAIFTVIIGVFSGVASYALQADISTWPGWAQPLLKDFLLFLSSTPAIFALAFFRNILGFLYNWIANHKTASVTYDFDRTAKTIALYLSFAGPIAAAVPAPYNTLALPVTFILDLAVSQINKIINPTAGTTITPPSTGSNVTYSPWLKVGNIWQRYVYTPNMPTTIQTSSTDPNSGIPVVSYSAWVAGTFTQGTVWVRNVYHSGVFFDQEYSSTDPVTKVTPISAPAS